MKLATVAPGKIPAEVAKLERLMRSGQWTEAKEQEIKARLAKLRVTADKAKKNLAEKSLPPEMIELHLQFS